MVSQNFDHIVIHARDGQQNLEKLDNIFVTKDLANCAMDQVELTSRFGRRITLGELLHHKAEQFSDRPFVTQAESGDTLSYAEFELRTNRLAHGFLAHFQHCSCYVAIMLETTIDYLALTYALKKIDRVEVSVNRAFRGISLSRMINLTEADVLVTSAAHLNALKAISYELKSVKQMVILDDCDMAREFFPHLQVTPFSELLSDDSSHIVSRANDTDVATIMFTSGTTGISKGCMLSHRYAVRTAENMIAPFRLNAADIGYTPYPLSHIGPAYYDILPMLLVGAQVVLRDGFSLSSFWPDLIRYRCTWFMCLGSVQQLLYAAQPAPMDIQHSVTRCWATPAPVPRSLFEQRFNLHLLPGGGYGSTDAGWVVVPQWDKEGGLVLPHFDIMIADENGDQVPSGDSGELLIRPLEPGVMSDGYFGMPEATVESRRNCWFHTGDIASVDNEGLFYFHCRKSERLRVKGEMVNAFEIEESVLLHPAIEDAAAVGVPAGYGEETIHLYVTLKNENEINEALLRDHCSQHLAKFMVPTVITILDNMPRTPTGKPEKGTLRERSIVQLSASKSPTDKL